MPEARLGEKVLCILEPAAGVPEALSPLHFEWALAQETVEAQYDGGLTWKADGEEIRFALELPLKED